MISELEGLCTFPIIINFFKETLTFKKIDSKTLSLKSCHFLPNRLTLPLPWNSKYHFDPGIFVFGLRSSKKSQKCYP